MAEGFWGFVIIGGPILLALVLGWAILHNRTSRRSREMTEEATRRRYQEQNAEDQARERS